MRETDIETFAQHREAGAPVVDVREGFEYANAHVEGSLLIPLGELAARTAEVPPGEMVFVICATGNRSLAGADILTAAGRPAVSVASGVSGWLRSGRPIATGQTVR